MPAVLPRQKKKVRRNEIKLDDLLGTVDAVVIACGIGKWTVTAIKYATRGTEDNPWSGRFTTKRRIKDWLLSHPDFRAYKVLRKSPKTQTA